MSVFLRTCTQTVYGFFMETKGMISIIPVIQINYSVHIVYQPTITGHLSVNVIELVCVHFQPRTSVLIFAVRFRLYKFQLFNKSANNLIQTKTHPYISYFSKAIAFILIKW